LDYRGHSIAASVAVTGVGGDEISYSKAVVEQKEGSPGQNSLENFKIPTQP
jgi:hypothetical protein